MSARALLAGLLDALGLTAPTPAPPAVLETRLRLSRTDAGGPRRGALRVDLVSVDGPVDPYTRADLRRALTAWAEGDPIPCPEASDYGD